MTSLIALKPMRAARLNCSTGSGMRKAINWGHDHCLHIRPPFSQTATLD